MLRQLVDAARRSVYAAAALRPSRRAALAHMQAILARRPVGLNLECHSRCNAQCVFCPRRKIPQRGSPMSMETFEKICRDYSAMGGGYMGFSPVLADPLLDPALLDRVAYARRAHPDIKLHLFTNLIALSSFSDEEVRALVGGLRILNVSIGGVNREDYRTMFGVDRFEAVWESLHRVARLADRRRCVLNLCVRTSRPVRAVRASPELRALDALGWSCRDVINTFTAWGGLVAQEDLPQGARIVPVRSGPRASPCLIPLTYLTVLPDGSVLGCSCVDAKRELGVGDVTSQSLGEIWAGDAMRKVRAASQAAPTAVLCGRCSYYMPGHRMLSEPRLRRYREGDDLWGSSPGEDDRAGEGSP